MTSAKVNPHREAAKRKEDVLESLKEMHSDRKKKIPRLEEGFGQRTGSTLAPFQTHVFQFVENSKVDLSSRDTLRSYELCLGMVSIYLDPL